MILMKKHAPWKYILIYGTVFLILLASWYFIRGGTIRIFKPSKYSVHSEYTIAIDSTWYPLQVMGREKNLYGFTSELLTIVGERGGFDVQLIDVGPNLLQTALDNGRFDAIVSSMTPNVIREENYLFSNPYYLYGPVLIVRNDSVINSPEDLKGKIIGIPSGTQKSIQYPSLLLIPYESISFALDNLEKKKFDGVVMDAIPAYVQIGGSYSGRLKIITSPLTDKGLRIVTKKHPESVLLISRFNEGLQKVIDESEYDALIKKWGLINPVLKEK